MPMPYDIIELPFRGSTRKYKKYPTGMSHVATDEEVAAWAEVTRLRAEAAGAQAACDALAAELADVRARVEGMTSPVHLPEAEPAQKRRR